MSGFAYPILRILHTLPIWLEYSNELWNWIFDQAQYNDANRPSNLNYGRAAAEKAKKVFQIWHTVFGAERCRVKRVLGLQAGYNGLNEDILFHLPSDEWDMAAPTFYFGLDHTTSGNPVLDQGSTIQNIMQNATNAWNSFRPTVRQDYNTVHLLGKTVVTYEGGQHFVGNVFGQPYPYQQAMWDAQNSQKMCNFYGMMHDTIRRWGCRLAMHFTLASRQESVYGSWGALPDIDVQGPYNQTAKKYQALLDELPGSQCKDIITWSGQAGWLWSTHCNWDQARIPDASSTVVVRSRTPHYPQLNIPVMVKKVFLFQYAFLTILSGKTLTVRL